MAEINLDESMLDTLETEFDRLNQPDKENDDENSTDDKGGDQKSTGDSDDSASNDSGGDDDSTAADGGSPDDSDSDSNGDSDLSDIKSGSEGSTDGGETDSVKDQIEEEFRHPPTTWTAEAKSKWDTLEPWAKREVHKREKDGLNGVNALKPKAEFADRMNQTIQPYQSMLNSMGVTPENAVKDALNLAYSLKTGSPQEKAVVLQNLAKQFGVDLKQEVQSNPEVDSLRNELRQLKQQQLYSQSQGQQQQLQQANQIVQEFASKTDDGGNLLHPYFHNVEGRMKALLESGAATTLENAYDQACWADPSIRSILQTQQSAEKDRQRKDQEQRQVDKAKKAQKVNLDKSATPDVKEQPKTIMDTLERAYDSLTAEG